MTNRSSKFAGTAGAGWLAFIAWCAPASAQGTSTHATLQQAAIDVRDAHRDSPAMEDESTASQHLCGRVRIPIQFALVLAVPVVLRSSPAFAQTSANPPEDKPSEKERPVSYGVEVELGSGHADRGLVISDRPVVQAVTWVSGSVAAFSVWSNITLGETTDGSRPQIVEMELTRAHEWRNFTVEPAVRMFFYRDPVSIYSSRSIEGWLYLSYHLGPFRLFANQSVDVLAYKGAYFGEAGIALERRVSPRIKVGGSFNTGWASSTFNDAWFGIDKSALNLTGVEGWLTVYVKPHFYIGPYFEFSTTVNRALRAELPRPTLFFVGLVTGVEF